MLPPSDSDEDEEEKPAKPAPKKEAGQVRRRHDPYVAGEAVE